MEFTYVSFRIHTPYKHTFLEARWLSIAQDRREMVEGHTPSSQDRVSKPSSVTLVSSFFSSSGVELISSVGILTEHGLHLVSGSSHHVPKCYLSSNHLPYNTIISLMDHSSPNHAVTVRELFNLH